MQDSSFFWYDPTISNNFPTSVTQIVILGGYDLATV
jgi:hypothetical protein